MLLMLGWKIAAATGALSCAFAPQQSVSKHLPTSSREAAFSPRLAAISVRDLETSFAWYRDVLGFRELARHNFPSDGLNILFAVRDGFELELIEKAGSISFDPPDPANPASRRGIGKLAFTVTDLANLQSRAEAAGAEFINRVRRSNRTAGCHLILADPDGTWVQLFGACPTPDQGTNG